MRLQGKVTQLESGSEYTDKQPRIKIKFESGTLGYNEIKIPNVGGYKLDDTVLFAVLAAEEADVTA